MKARVDPKLASAKPLPRPHAARSTPSTGGEERLQRLTTLLEVARMLTSELDLSEIVHQVLVRAIAVIPAADAGTLYLVDSSTGKLVATDSVGFGPSIFKIALEPGEGAAGRAYLRGHGEIFNDPEAVRAALSDATPDTLKFFREASRGLLSLHAAMSAPLIFKGKLLGVLVVDSMQTEHHFTQSDLTMLEDFAQISAIAIVNARLYGSEHTSRVRLEVLNDEITRQRDQLDRQLRALDSMSKIAREGLGLPGLSARIADLCSARVCIVDGLGRLRCAEPQQAGEHLLASPDLIDLLARVGHDHHRHMIIKDRQQLIASPVAAGGELLGYVVIASDDVESTSLNEAVADMAALIASTAFVHERALEEGNVRTRADLLQRLLVGDVPRSAASFRPLPPPLRLAVANICRPLPGTPERVGETNVMREVRIVAEQQLRNPIFATVAVIKGEYLVLAWSAPPADGHFNINEKLVAIAKAVRESTGWGIRFALTETITDPQLVPQIFQEARLAIEIRPWSDDPVIEVGRLGAYRLIIGAMTGSTALEFSRRSLSRVIEHDAKQKSHLLSTLRTYFGMGGSLSGTAKALNVHVHTIQYRLTRVEELSGLKLHDSEDRLTAELALRILDLAGPASDSE
jgi:GAF domain-containing protein